MTLGTLLLVVPAFAALAAQGAPSTPVIVVDPAGPVKTIGEALAAAPAGARITVRPGVYVEPTLVVTRPVTLEGLEGAVLDGEGRRALLAVAADDVTVRGLVLRHTGASEIDDRAAIAVDSARGCRIERNRIEDAFFAIHLARVSHCVVAGNVIEGPGPAAHVAGGGNGIHAWQSSDLRIHDNHVRGQRDGIYFEFVTGADVRNNVSEDNNRYGMHFMFSDDCRYEGNTFRANRAGVAVMYTRRVRMAGNRFEHNWGSASYGLLLKDITDSEVLRNRFEGNSVALYLEGANRNRVEGNAFLDNGWALRLLSNSQGNALRGNVFEGNTFDVATNSRHNFSTFRGNYWDRYRGYDLDRDGVGDAPFAPVRLFSLIVEQSPPTLLLVHSLVIDLLDLAERVLPVLTPETLVDSAPLMRAPKDEGP